MNLSLSVSRPLYFFWRRRGLGGMRAWLKKIYTITRSIEKTPTPPSSKYLFNINISSFFSERPKRGPNLSFHLPQLQREKHPLCFLSFQTTLWYLHLTINLHQNPAGHPHIPHHLPPLPKPPLLSNQRYAPFPPPPPSLSRCDLRFRSPLGDENFMNIQPYQDSHDNKDNTKNKRHACIFACPVWSSG